MEYEFLGNPDENVSNMIRKYPCNLLLKEIAKEAISLYKSDSKDVIAGIRHKEYTLQNISTKELLTQKVYVTGWNLIDLAYFTVLCTNDFRGQEMKDIHEMYTMISAVEGVRNANEGKFMESLDSNSLDFMLYLFGFAGEQLKMQHPNIALNNSARDLKIILDYSSRINNPIDAQKIIIDVMGCDWKEYQANLLLLWVGSLECTDMDEFSKKVVWKNDKFKSSFYKIAGRYTTDYREVRESEMKRQILYAKPLVRTDKKEVIFTNTFLQLFLVEHGVLWLLRDSMIQQNKIPFPSYFGECFELYFADVLHIYVEEKNIVRIPEGKKKRADWKLSLGKYTFLIEQKSAVTKLDIKQQATNLEAYRVYLERSVMQAIGQLYDTEKDYVGHECIKIILLYDDYVAAELLDYIFQFGLCKEKNDGKSWICNIDEMERLLFTYRNDFECFSKIIEDKLERKKVNYMNEKTFQTVLLENGITENRHVSSESVTVYFDSALEYTKSLLM